jgi:hypothetical protein
MNPFRRLPSSLRQLVAILGSAAAVLLWGVGVAIELLLGRFEWWPRYTRC